MPTSVDYLTTPAANNQAVRADAPPVSVVILTFNEENNIGLCLDSCAWCDDVHVLDSGSTDRTREIAEARGIRVFSHPFTSFGDQRNWAIDNIPCKHPWHFHLDADERFTPAIVQEMRKQLGADGTQSPYVAYLVPSKMILMDKWLRHSGGYPAYQMRLFAYAKCRFIDFGHGQREDARGEIGSLVNPYLHYNFSKGMNNWFRKHNNYSSQEAIAAFARRKEKFTFKALLSKDPLIRRRTLKNLTFFLRGRSVFRFVYMYVIRAGWLDSTPGFHYCAMMAMYEDWIELKMLEQEMDWPHQTSALARRLMGESP